MSSTADIDGRMSLGVGAIVGESFSIFFKHLVPVTLMALVPSLLSLLASGAMIGVDVVFGTALPDFSTSFGVGLWVMALVLQIAFYSLTAALLVQLAYDAKLGRTIQLGRYVAPAIRAAVPIAILSLIAGVMVAVASIALIIPGLYVYAVFSVITPAVVIERVGFGGLGRSADLTKDYRWPILGVLILIGICIGIFNYIAAFAAGLTVESGQLVAALAYLIPSALGAGLSGVSVALIYARLREIKEGVSVDQIASVFD
ncbi:hypothetical protein KUW17_19755 [Leisingera aquaemixtae]|uniref:hypothetical protein n=1 Tax=Leisingera aquaemixtae TaxID=1396826 RepID=UPI001C985189|nr:hypothetical protein [Leisingera aquaemixtae]MBY6068987.1 hypothetical protein [Leisingera aquaemixtae]